MQVLSGCFTTRLKGRGDGPPEMAELRALSGLARAMHSKRRSQMVFDERRDPSWSPGSASPKTKERSALVLRGALFFCAPQAPGGGRPSALVTSGARPLRGHPSGRAFALAALRAVASLRSEGFARLVPPRPAGMGRWQSPKAAVGGVGSKAGHYPSVTASRCHLPIRCANGEGLKVQPTFATPLSSSICCNSPASNISIMMSLPPTNSPFT